MKVAIVSTVGNSEGLMGHTGIATLGRTEDSTALLVESPILPVDPNLLMINTSVGIQNYILNKQIATTVNNHLGLTGEPGSSSLYAFWNGQKFSDWMEVVFSTRFMSGNVGPEIGFSMGIALRVDCDIKLALPQMEEIENFLKETEYRGEVLLTITEDFRIVRMHFGHFYGHFGLYTELSRLGKVDGILEFLGQLQKELVLGDALGIGNIVTVPPFPLNLPQIKSRAILAPQSAEKHLWRIRSQSNQIVLATVRGLSLLEAKRRMRRTMENMSSYNPDIQYRIDYGQNRASFVLCPEKFHQMSENRTYDKSSIAQSKEEIKDKNGQNKTEGVTHIITPSLEEVSPIIS